VGIFAGVVICTRLSKSFLLLLACVVANLMASGSDIPYASAWSKDVVSISMGDMIRGRGQLCYMDAMTLGLFAFASDDERSKWIGNGNQARFSNAPANAPANADAKAFAPVDSGDGCVIAMPGVTGLDSGEWHILVLCVCFAAVLALVCVFLKKWE
jgi:hypothetical protein